MTVLTPNTGLGVGLRPSHAQASRHRSSVPRASRRPLLSPPEGHSVPPEGAAGEPMVWEPGFPAADRLASMGGHTGPGGAVSLISLQPGAGADPRDES